MAVDSSTREDATVTVAVELPNRDEEFRLLDQLSAIARQEGVSEFKLFSNKAHDISIEDNREFFERIIEHNREKLLGYQHIQRGGETLHEIEAVHTALLIDSILEPYEDRVTIIDGGKQKAKPAVNALSGVRDVVPAVTHCFKSETYYPQSLLADLVASYLSYTVRSGRYNYDEPLLRVPYAEQNEDRWGEAFSAMKSRSERYNLLDLAKLQGKSPRQRVQCWYHGGMARTDADTPPSDSITPVIKLADEKEFDDAKAELERLR